jgi:putative endopeptidase
MRIKKTKNKHNKSKNNRTKKCKLTERELYLMCNTSANTLNRFENQYENKFKHSLKNENINIEKQLIKLFSKQFTPSNIKVENDYYTWVNYQWLNTKQKELLTEKKYYVQVDSFRMGQEKVYYELIDIVKQYTKTDNSLKSQSIKNLYNSLLHLDDYSAKDYVKWVTLRMDYVIASNNLYRMLAEFNQNEIISWGCPIVWNVLRDEKNSKIYRSNISAPQLSIYDYTIYIEDVNDDENTKKYKSLFKRKYFEYIHNIFNACYGSNHGFKTSDVWDCEYEILLASLCNSIKNDDEYGYNLVTKEDSIKKCGLDWEELAKQIGYKDVPDKYICRSLNYIKCILETLTKDDAWKTKKWRTYFLYIILRQLIRFNKKWRHIYYEFNGKFIKGQPVILPNNIYPIFGLSLCFNNFLSTEYIKRNKNEKQIQYTTNLALDLLIVFKRIIKRNTWLSEKTKKYALLKLENINLIIGYPNKIADDPILSYKSKGAYQNLKKMAVWRTKRFIELDGKESNIDMPFIDWAEFKLVGKQPYIVNAYYTPTENSIYVPLAYLQKPFIDLDERGIEYNLAFIGYTLAHEMSHSLDDMGSKFDYKGNLHNWWTKEDRHKFELKVKDVIKQYETFAKYDGIKMDASLSTGENLADISGLAICEEYLRDFLDNNDVISQVQALSFESFFTYIAIQSRQVIFQEAVKAQLKINPHPMDKYRTNCPLARLELFRSIYNIKKGDKMYWHSTDTIW